MKKRLLSIALSLVMIVAMIPTTVFAIDTAPSGNWSEYAATDFAGGTGTKGDPYQIATAEQFAKLSNDVAGGISYEGMYFKLESNIDLSAHIWSPIGVYIWPSSGSTVSAPFRGFFDGNHCTISGLYVDERTTLNAAGLFGYIGKVTDDTEVGVKNLTIKDAVIYSNEAGLYRNEAGILAGFAMANPGQSIYFDGITVSGQIITESTNNRNKVGGMVGDAYRCIFADCHVMDVTITGAGNCGGFAGNAFSGSFENCSASGTISGSGAIGGFVGYSAPTNTSGDLAPSYSQCTADVAVTGYSWQLGGFVGSSLKSSFENCAAYGDVTSTMNLKGYPLKTGGFAGENNGADISQCHAAGTVSAVSEEGSAGGFVGSATSGTITDSSYDAEKNPNLSASGTGTAGTDGVDAGSTDDVLGNLCEDIYGGHAYSEEWTIDVEATCTTPGSKSQHCTRCDAKTDVTEIQAIGHQTELQKAKDATCTEEGYTGDKVCTVCGEVVERGSVIAKLPHNFEDGKCTVCGTIDSTFRPVITAGANGEWQKDSKDGLSFTSNAAFGDFQKVQVDGKDLDASNYTVKEGSTIVTLKAEYLGTLSAGTHTLAIVSETGTATTEFTIKAAATDDESSQTPDADKDDTNTPQTGDDSNMAIWFALLFVSGSALFGATAYSRKKKYSK